MPQWKSSHPGVHIGVDGLKEDMRLGGYLGWERPGRRGGIADQVSYSTVLKELAKTSKAGHHLLAFFFFSNWARVVYFCSVVCLPCHCEDKYPRVLRRLDAIPSLNVLKRFSC